MARAAADVNVDLWLIDLERGIETRFTFDPANDLGPRWSADGSQIAFVHQTGGGFELYRKDVSGVVPEELLLRSDRDLLPSDWSPDGEFVLFRGSDSKTGADILRLPLAGERKPEVVVRSPFNDTTGRISPDGRWLAYVSNESGRNEVYVVQFPVAGRRVQISTAGGIGPHWRGDGGELYFSAAAANMAVNIGVSGTGELQVGVPLKLFTPTGALERWDVSRDGQRFLINVMNRTGLEQQPADQDAPELGSPMTLEPGNRPGSELGRRAARRRRDRRGLSRPRPQARSQRGDRPMIRSRGAPIS